MRCYIPALPAPVDQLVALEDLLVANAAAQEVKAQHLASKVAPILVAAIITKS